MQCSACFWLNQGRWMQKLASPECVGQLIGLFFMLSNSSSIIGNTLSYLISEFAKISTPTLLWCLIGVHSTGLLMLLFISDVERTNDSGTILSRARNLARLKSHRPSMLIAPYCVALGVSGAFNYGSIPTLIYAGSHNTGSISLAFIFYGIGSTLGSYTFGRLFDRFGWKVDLAANVGTLSMVTALSCLTAKEIISTTSCFMYILMLFAGMNDSIYTCLINISVSKVYTEELSASGWTAFRVFYCAGFAAYSFLTPSMSFTTSLTASALIQTLGLLSYFFFGRSCFTEAVETTRPNDAGREMTRRNSLASKHVSFSDLSKPSSSDTVINASGISRSVSIANIRGEV